MLVVMVLVLLVIVVVVVLGHRCLRGGRTIVRSWSSRVRLVGPRVLRHPVLNEAG
jgi:hypothetical protein